MIAVGIIIGIILLAGMIYMALSKKTDAPVRMASLIALGLMILTVIISGIRIFTAGQEPPADMSVVHVVPQPVEPQAGDVSTFGMLVFIFFFLALLAAVVYISMKEQKKKLAEEANAKELPIKGKKSKFPF